MKTNKTKVIKGTNKSSKPTLDMLVMGNMPMESNKKKAKKKKC